MLISIHTAVIHVSFYVTSYRVILHHVILYYVISYHVMLSYFNYAMSWLFSFSASSYFMLPL